MELCAGALACGAGALLGGALVFFWAQTGTVVNNINTASFRRKLAEIRQLIHFIGDSSIQDPFGGQKATNARDSTGIQHARLSGARERRPAGSYTCALAIAKSASCGGQTLPKPVRRRNRFLDFPFFAPPGGLIYCRSFVEGRLRYLDRLQPLALLVMRLALGAIMLAHGYQNSFHHLRDHVHFVASLGIPQWLGYVSSFTELLGGLLILVGFFARPAAFAISIDLVVAIWKVHWHNGLLGSPDRPGYEFALAAAALAFALIFFGAGPIALDHVLRGGGSVPKRS